MSADGQNAQKTWALGYQNLQKNNNPKLQNNVQKKVEIATNSIASKNKNKYLLHKTIDTFSCPLVFQPWRTEYQMLILLT